MVSKSPLFSIVIPTRNRAHLLPNALRSALNQDFDDYEVIVVANDCKDNTREVVHKLANYRVRYFETDKMLTMPENWDFAWTKTTGKYVTYLCDDDAFLPSTLKFLAEKALSGNPPIVTWEDANYYYPDWHDDMLQNILLLFWTGNKQIEDVSSTILRRQLANFACAWNAPIPKLLNCIVHRDFFENWRNRLGGLFYPTSPDYSLAWVAAHICDYYRIVHRPLCVRGVSDNSIGCNGGFGDAAEAYLQEFGQFNFFSETKINLPLLNNHLADTYLRSSVGLIKGGITPEPIDPHVFYTGLAKQFLEYQHRIKDSQHLQDDFLEKSKLISSSLYEEVKQIFSEPIKMSPQNESIRNLHKRTRKMALEYLPNIEKALQRYDGNPSFAFASLALQDDILVDANWNYLYLFGEAVNSYDIYTMSYYVDKYYDFLGNGKNKFLENNEIKRNISTDSWYKKLTKIMD